MRSLCHTYCRLRGALQIAAPVLALCAFASCAMPQPPTGGEPIRTPPLVASVEPETGTVNFDGESVEIVFENYVDRGSVDQALSVAPAMERRPEVRVRGRRVVISFTEPLQENTTYIVTLDTDLRTARNVRLEEPITIAFATGPTIDRGHLSGRVYDIERDEAAEAFDVYAYAAPDSLPPDTLPDRPTYRTQTDSDGTFTFDHLREQPYFVIALEDRNRNRRPDPDEPFAVPPRPALFAHPTEEAVDTLIAAEDGAPLDIETDESDTSGTAEDMEDELDPWLVTRLDTIPPEIQRARARTRHYLQVRFTEPVHLADRSPDAWRIVTDDEEQHEAGVREVFMRPDSDREVHVLTDPLEARPYRIYPAGVADLQGNVIPDEGAPFDGVADDAPLALEFLGFVPDEDQETAAIVFSGEQPGVVFNQPLTESRFRELVQAQDTSGTAWSFTPRTEDGTTYLLEFNPAFSYGDFLDVIVDERTFEEDVDTLTTQRFEHVPESELGELSGIAAAEDTTASIIVELFRNDQDLEDGPYRTLAAGEDGSFMFDDLPEGSYRLRLFVDLNENERWDGGTIIPYRLPEPIRWVEGAEQVRPRWESAIEDTIHVPAPR